MDMVTSLELSDAFPYDLIDQNRASFEKTLNVVGYIPAISVFSGAIRALSGVASIVVSAVKGSFLLIADLFSNQPFKYPYRSYKHLTYIGHGLLNVIRGIIEGVPVAGNLLCLGYDFLIGRIYYSVEKTGPHYVLKNPSKQV